MSCTPPRFELCRTPYSDDNLFRYPWQPCRNSHGCSASRKGCTMRFSRAFCRRIWDTSARVEGWHLIRLMSCSRKDMLRCMQTSRRHVLELVLICHAELCMAGSYPVVETPVFVRLRIPPWGLPMVDHLVIETASQSKMKGTSHQDSSWSLPNAIEKEFFQRLSTSLDAPASRQMPRNMRRLSVIDGLRNIITRYRRLSCCFGNYNYGARPIDSIILKNRTISCCYSL